jgi:hypothetical protein
LKIQLKKPKAKIDGSIKKLNKNEETEYPKKEEKNVLYRLKKLKIKVKRKRKETNIRRKKKQNQLFKFKNQLLSQ